MISELVKELLEPEQTVLVHGTSIEAALSLIAKGAMLREQFTKNNLYRGKRDHRGRLFFVPNTGAYSDVLKRQYGINAPDIRSWNDTLESAATYAKIKAAEHYIGLLLGYVPVSAMRANVDASTKDLAQSHTLKLIRTFEEEGFTNRQALKHIAEAGRRKGVLIGFGKDILKYQIEPGKDNPDGEVCIYAPNGLPIQCVTGIKPLGSLERTLLYIDAKGAKP